MLRKEDILGNLKASGLDLSRCWITAGGALVFHGLRESTADIDMGCEPSLADELQHAGCTMTLAEQGRRRFHLDGNIDLSEDWARGTVSWIEGVPVVSLEDILALKRQLGRPKDQADIETIEKVLAGCG